MDSLSILLGDVTQQDVDVIVNAANTRMRGGSGVDGAIHRVGGVRILKECIEKYPHGVATGDVGVTTAGDLPAKWVIHAVGPDYRIGQTDPESLVSCYARAIAAAEVLGAQSMAFPLISAGVYSWPLRAAADIAVRTILKSRTSIRDIRLVAFSKEAHSTLWNALVLHQQIAMLEGVRILHQKGFQQVRILPYMSPNGTAWRLDIDLAEGLRHYAPSKATEFRIYHSSASLLNSDDSAIVFAGFPITPATTAEEYSDLIAWHLALEKPYDDPEYASWYRGLFDLVIQENALPVAFYEYKPEGEPWIIGQSTFPEPPA